MCNVKITPLNGTVQANIIIMLILNALPAVATIIGNLAFIVTLIRTRSLHRPSNILLGGLCVSDLLVGFVVQPVYISFLFKLLLDDDIHKGLQSAFTICFFLSGGLSFSFAAQMSLDRYVAICHPFFYCASATCKRYIASVIVTSAAWAAFALLQIDKRIMNSLPYQTIVILYIIGTTLTILICYGRIFLILLKKRNSVLSIGTIDGRETQEENCRKEKEKAKTHMIGIIIAFFLLSYLPYVSLVGYFAFRGSSCWDSDHIFLMNLWVNAFLLWNSSMNMIIYSVKSTEIRRACIRTFSCLKKKEIRAGEEERSKKQICNGWRFEYRLMKFHIENSEFRALVA